MLSVRIKYVFLIHSLFLLHTSSTFLCVLLKIHVFEVVSTSIFAVAILGAHQVGETRTSVMLPFAWVGNLRVGKEGEEEDNLTVKILHLLSN